MASFRLPARRGLRRLAAGALLLAGAGGLRASIHADAGWERYLQRAAVLRRHRDEGALQEKDVLKVLREAGVFEPLPDRSGRRGHASFAKGFRPFDVRVYKGLWRWPLRYGVVSSEYGPRWGRRHRGVDIAADPGDPVYAAAPGEVIFASSTLRGYGNVVILRHDHATTSLYAHNARLLVAPGQRVRLGERIALVGSTGRSTGPHVHFEVRRGERALDPRGILPKTRF